MANLNRVRSLASLLLFVVLLWFPDGAGADTPPEIPASYEQVAENDLFTLHVDSSTLAFKLVDRRSDYLWHSGLDALIDGDRLNSSWQAFAKSGISIEYLDERGVNRRVSIANAEHTLAITPIENGISAQIVFTEYSIAVSVMVQLEAEGVRVEIPFASVREDDPAFRLGRVYMYPFLGAVRGSTIPGYMLLPDGSGSLVEFADSTRAQNMFYARYYGPDLGMLAEQPHDEMVNQPYPISFPVFGMVHGAGENAFLSVVEQGAAYGELQVHPAAIITNFNFLYHAFIYNETYFQATNRSGAGVTAVQGQPNAFDAVIHYRFLTGDDADYVGMARSYQQYLVDRSVLRAEAVANPNIGMRLEFLGGDAEIGALTNRFIPMTTVDGMRDILADLQIPNPEVIYYGWQPSGATSMPPTSLAVDGLLGSVEGLRALADTIAAAGGHFSLYLDPQSALRDSPGYSAHTDVAMAITNVELIGFNRSFGGYLTLDVLRTRYAALSGAVAAHPSIGFSLDTIGSMLYTDYRNRPPFSREDARGAYQTLLTETPVRLGLYRPNDYLFGQAAAYYDLPLGDNGYIYTSSEVPFLPIVLAGYLPYYGTALNFSSDRQEDLLRHVEYGIYPSYFLTQEPTAEMLNTRSGWIYTSSYEQWGGQVRTTYAWMNALLAPVRGQQIVAHELIERGVFVTTYANGRRIVVNYNEVPFTGDGFTVAANDAVLLEETP